MKRIVALPIVVLALGLAAIAAITVLQQRSDAGRDAELALATIKIELNQLQNAPFRADKSTGGSPALARRLMRDGKQRIGDALAELRRQSPPAQLDELSAPLRADYVALDEIYSIGVSGKGYVAVCDAFDAMVCERPYRKAMSVSEALAEVRRCSGSQFDPVVVDAFCVVAASQARAMASTVA